MNNKNRVLADILGSGDCIRNAWMTIGDPYLAEIVATGGAFDALTFDMQHGLIDQRAAIDCIRAVKGMGCSAMVRLPKLDESLIGILLDAGIDGLILPQVNSADEAIRFVASCEYPPHGTRSFGPTRSGLSGQPNERFLLFAMIETADGLQNANRIAAVKRLDGLFIGPGDLGISLGIGAGQDRSEPEFVEAVNRIKSAVTGAGKRLGIHTNSAEYAAQKVLEGFQLVTTWVDVVGVKSSIAQAVNDWKKVLPKD